MSLFVPSGVLEQGRLSVHIGQTVTVMVKISHPTAKQSLPEITQYDVSRDLSLH